MKEYEISGNYLYCGNNGSQPKYKKDNYWYKIDKLGNEGKAEELTSLLLSCSNISYPYAYYEQCIINGKNGCRSENFLKEGETLYSFASLYNNITGNKISEDIRLLNTPKERIDFILNFISDNFNADVKEYLSVTMETDWIIRNPDRHFNNFSMILTPDNIWKPAPIYDNGQGLGQNHLITPPMDSYNSFVLKTKDAAFGSYEESVHYLGIPFKINYDKLNNALSLYKDTHIIKILKARLSELKNDIALDKNCDLFDKYLLDSCKNRDPDSLDGWDY